MKDWLKKNKTNLFGNFFIWVVPLMLALVMAFGGTKTQTSTSFKIAIWGIIIVVIYLLIYYKKIRKMVDRQKTIQIANLGRVKVWVRLIELISYLLPYAIALVLIIVLKDIYVDLRDDLITFIVSTMISATIGYSILIVDTKSKE